jgi:hypothetical protein
MIKNKILKINKFKKIKYLEKNQKTDVPKLKFCHFFSFYVKFPLFAK